MKWRTFLDTKPRNEDEIYLATQWPSFCEEIQMKRNNMESHMITASPDKASPWGVGCALP